MFRKLFLYVFIFCGLIQFIDAQEKKEVKCPVVRDTWISTVGSEANTNGGKSAKIKLKVLQEYGLLDIDVSALKGKKISNAFLFVAPEGGVKFGGARGTDLRWFTVSTVASPWEEGLGMQYDVDAAGKGATFLEASHGTRKWAYPGSKGCDVILGNSHTIRIDVDAGDPIDGWFKIPLNQRQVEALVAGASYGLAILDGSTGIDRNCHISSREGKRPPYLLVTVEGDNNQAPKEPSALTFAPMPNNASNKMGAAKISFKVPENAFSYNIKVGGQLIPRWATPLALKAGETQTILLEDLAPNADTEVEIAAVDGAGNTSAFAKVKGKSSTEIIVPKLPESNWKTNDGKASEQKGNLKVWAYPEGCKVDPIGGEIILEPGMNTAKVKNSVWDSNSGTVRIAAARGEIAGFHLALESTSGPVEGIKIEISGLKGVQTKQWRAWFVSTKEKWQAEYAIPLKAEEKLAIPAADNKIPDQKVSSIAVDIIVPTNAPAESQVGVITITTSDSTIKLNLKLDVFKAVIPNEINFNPELNDYGGPSEAGSAAYFEYYKLAHYHRCTINTVPYSQTGRFDSARAPAIQVDGSVKDWTNYDKAVGPLLDGSAFKDNPRAGVPVPTLYLPHFENWPMSIKAHYKPGDAATLSGKSWKGPHDIFAKSIDESFSKEYQQGFTKNVSDFVSHFEEKKWNRTMLEFYLNNKPNGESMVSTAWTLDEPAEYLDWRAINFFSSLFHNGLKGVSKSKFLMRGDISRPEWQGSCSDGLMDIMYANGGQLSMPRLMREHKRRMPTILYCYGECNDVIRPNHETVAWCLKSFALECDGVLPWKSLSGEAAFQKPDKNGLIVDGSKLFGVPAIASFRIHSLRTGAQIAELLKLLQEKNGWGRTHCEAIISQVILLESKFVQAFSDDAAAVTFEGINGDTIVKLKEGILKLLEAN